MVDIFTFMVMYIKMVILFKKGWLIILNLMEGINNIGMVFLLTQEQSIFMYDKIIQNHNIDQWKEDRVPLINIPD